jgi:hypothetical protein
VTSRSGPKPAAASPAQPDPLARLLAALIGEASLYIARASETALARREAGATIDRILSGLRPGAGARRAR